MSIRRHRDTKKKSKRQQNIKKKIRPPPSSEASDLLVNRAITNRQYGRLVWGKVPGSRIWPGIIIDHKSCGMPPPNETRLWMFWFGDNRVTQGLKTKVVDFIVHFGNCFFSSSLHSSATRIYRAGVIEILKECQLRGGLNVKGDESLEELVQWAKMGFPNTTNSLDIYFPSQNYEIPPKMKKYLDRLKLSQNGGKLEGVQERVPPDEFPTSSSSSESDSDSEERRTWKPKASLLKRARRGSVALSTLCIACEKVDCVIVSSHPFFEGGLCEACRSDVHSLIGSVAYDGHSKFCCVCSSPGEILLCDNHNCDKVFCVGCIEILVSTNAVERIKKMDPWHCFLCTNYNASTHGLLIPRPDWRIETEQAALERRKKLLDTLQLEETPPVEAFKGTPLRVLSLFDGIGTGLYVIKQLGLKVESYFASEVDGSAINVCKINFGPQVENVGDIQYLTNKQVEDLCPIDLLIGGSPCNDLSCVNPNRKGLYDPTGTGILFFHYFRVLNVILRRNKDRHLFWLFENVVNMPKEFRYQISLFLQREPVVIDAKYFSPQKRERFFWGNIPEMYKPLPEEFDSDNFPLSQCLMKECGRQARVSKINCVTTNSNSLLIGGGHEKPIQHNDRTDVPWITELEKIFGYTPHFTDVGNLGIRERQSLLARAWSVPVINYILSPLKHYYPSERLSDSKTLKEPEFSSPESPFIENSRNPSASALSDLNISVPDTSPSDENACSSPLRGSNAHINTIQTDIDMASEQSEPLQETSTLEQSPVKSSDVISTSKLGELDIKKSHGEERQYFHRKLRSRVISSIVIE